MLIDGGDFAAAPGNELRTEYLLRGMKELGYGAIAIGERDLSSGPEFLREVGERLDIPFVATNLATADGAPLGARVRIVEAKAGKRTVRVGVFAVLHQDHGYDLGTVRVEAPKSEARRALEELRGKADVIVCVAHMSRLLAHQLVEDVPGIDLVLTGHQPAARRETDLIGRTIVADAAPQGKQIRVIEWSIAPRGSQGTAFRQAFLAPLGDDVPEDEQMLVLVNEYESKMSGRSPTGPAEVAFVGPQSCTTCHAGAHAQWSASGHANAFRTLEEAGFATSECLPCHTTGFRQPGGFVNAEASPDLASVGCEACHGPGEHHILSRAPAASQLRGGTVPVTKEQGRLRVPGEAQCRACHDAENDPDFDYAAASAAIAHGLDRASR